MADAHGRRTAGAAAERSQSPRLLAKRARLARIRRLQIGLAVASALVSAIGFRVAFASRSARQTAATDVGVSFRLSSQPPGASIAIDGVDTGQVTPAVLQNWDFALPHELSLRLAGFYPETRKVEIGLHPADVEVELARTAKLSLRSQPSGAAALIGDRQVGTTPLELDVPAGRDVQLSLRLAGYLPAAVKLRPNPDEPQVRDVQLQPESTLVVQSDPPGAQVSVDGEAPLPTPATFLVQAEVPHQIQLSVPDLAPQKRRVVLKEHQRLEVHVHFEDPEDQKLRTELAAVRARLAVDRRQLALIQEKGSSSSFSATFARLHDEDRWADEIDRLDAREQQLSDQLSGHRTELEDRMQVALLKAQ